MLNCIAPQEIEEGDLLAYLSGSAPPSVIYHIEKCAFCTAEAAALQEMDELFGRALYRENCPPADDLLQYHAGFLNKAEQKQVKKHLGTCTHCQREIRQIMAVTAVATPVASPSITDRLRQTGKQIVTAILSPTAYQPVMALRGDEDVEEIYQAQGYQIILAKKPPLAVEKVWQLEGQIMWQEDPLTPMTGTATLLQKEETIREDALDEFGYFAMENIMPGAYTLRIDLAALQINIDKFAIP